MQIERQFFLFAALAYALSTLYSVFLWRKNFRRDDFVNYLLLTLGFYLSKLLSLNRVEKLDSLIFLLNCDALCH